MNPESVQLEIIALLKRSFEGLRAKYPGYSLRRFSKKMAVPSPIVSQVLSGKRRITRQLAERLLLSLDIDSRRKHSLIEALPRRRIRATSGLPRAEVIRKVELSATEFQVVSDWWYFAILALLDSGVKISRVEDLRRYFRLSPSQLRGAVANLERLGLIRIEKTQISSTGKSFTTTNEISDAGIRSNHIQGLELARAAIHEVAVDRRDFSAVTVALDPAQLAPIKRQITRYRRNLERQMEATRGQEVYRLQIQLFPLSQSKEKSK